MKKGRVDKHPLYKTPTRIFEIDSAPSRRDPRKIADDVVRELAPRLKVDPATLKFDAAKKSPLGTHVLYQQFHDGVPISNAWLRVHIAPDGRVFEVQSDVVPRSFIAKMPPSEMRLTAEEAEARAMEAAGTAEEKHVLGHELVHLPVSGIPRLCWKVLVRTLGPSATWKFYIDARDGAVVERHDILRRATGRGLVFDPNPVVTLNDDMLDNDSTIPPGAYKDVALDSLDGSGFLDGAFISTALTKHRVKSPDLRFLYSREQNGFTEVMVYYHVDSAHRRLVDLGFPDIVSFPIKANVAASTDDDSEYDPPTKSLNFGTGGVPDAEDAEVILHEYGHAIQDDQVPGFGEGDEAGAMGEGFGDFWAASFFFDLKPSFFRPTIMNWDATAYSGAEPPNLRRVDSNKRYPKDMVYEVHSDGEMWSASLWQLRDSIGRERAERLIIAHHYLLHKRASFDHAVNALITADQQLYGGAHVQNIIDIFIDRGMYDNPRRKNLRSGMPFAQQSGPEGS